MNEVQHYIQNVMDNKSTLVELKANSRIARREFNTARRNIHKLGEAYDKDIEILERLEEDYVVAGELCNEAEGRVK